MTQVKTDVQILIAYLNRINNGEVEVVVEDGYIYADPSKTSDESTNTMVVCLANDALVVADGGTNWDSVSLLKAAGFHTYAGEKDSYGWLTGCIDTKKGTIVCG
jgi:hypothetical protein